MPQGNLLRPRDSDALRSELRHIAAASGVPVVFGGEVSAQTLRLTEFRGTRTRALDGLLIPIRSGLGGRVLEQRTPAAVSDYGSARSITHDYDQPVLGEGLKSILAVPVVVAGASRAVMYAAVRERGPLGDRVAQAMIKASERLSYEFTIRDEVDRRVALLHARPVRSESAATTRRRTEHEESLREVHAELRVLATSTRDASTRTRLAALSDRIAAEGSSLADAADITLTAREIDVLAQIALGCSNALAAERLSLRPETVKSYLRAVMNKTGTRTRHEAVVAVRKLGLLP